ncbi:MAG: NAD+ synthase [Candidatus Muiribacterium halophilum]|uniref:Glutamine-dependent NAD(+) synthetase n=1 Tax=Muiribacterium halophilum TaxID=2053465 RepID=A0A2N5ZH79_MUIH1|nr:MAG: NAD+ synthase [Candidatus Muirbacterium halophilum]
MKIALNQINPKIGAFENNLLKIKENIVKASEQKVDICIFPELCVCGYPPIDLLERGYFIRKCKDSIAKICEISKKYNDMALIIGSPMEEDGELFNCAVVVKDGKIDYIWKKILLPHYDVFDEKRYFISGDIKAPYIFKGKKIAISVCEDIWPVREDTNRSYSDDLVNRIIPKDADFIVNISASPFYDGKIKKRRELFKSIAKVKGKIFVYVNQVGGNDEIIFDGSSFVLNSFGGYIFNSPSFSESFDIVDLSNTKEVQASEDVVEKNILDALVLGVRDYFNKLGFKKAVIGLSGGIDSTLVAYVAVKALGSQNVRGITMPSKYSSEGSISHSKILADNLGIKMIEIPIGNTFDSYLDTLDPFMKETTSDITEENIQARIRGNILMAFSNKFGDIVLSTGNKSEMSVGYSTLYGDMSGGLAVIGDVPKIMVYRICEYINREKEIIPREIIDKEPSAELRPDQKDSDSLPPYEILDSILRYYLENHLSADEIIQKGFEAETVKWVISAVDRNEYKRKQAPVVLKVTSKAFGSGRRIPIVAQGNA